MQNLHSNFDSQKAEIGASRRWILGMAQFPASWYTRPGFSYSVGQMYVPSHIPE